MQSSGSFERVPETSLERLPSDIKVEHYRQRVQERFASALKPKEKARGWQILLVPERTIIYWETKPRDLRWVANVGAVFDGHRKYYGVYAGDASIFTNSYGGFKLKAGRPVGTGKGYSRLYQFRLAQQMFQDAARLVSPPKGRGTRSEWLRLFILKGAEALTQGSPWTEVEVERTEQGASARKVEGVRVTRAEEVEIERWRNGGVDYELMLRLFGVGVAYLEAQGRDTRTD